MRLSFMNFVCPEWDIETWIGDAKEVLGLDYYQLTSVKSVPRFLYLGPPRQRLLPLI